jgi:hypothetical protein
VKSGRVLFPSGQGEVEILFALNRWVLVRLPNGQSVQRQVGREDELAALLRELGLTDAEARAAASEAWRERPATAGLRDAHSRESLRGATGLTAGMLLLIVGTVVAVLVALAVYALTHLP